MVLVYMTRSREFDDQKSIMPALNKISSQNAR